MASLIGRSPKNTFREILKIGTAGGLDANLTAVSDGAGTDSPLKLSTTNVAIHDMLWPVTGATVGKVLAVGTTSLEWIDAASASATNPAGNTSEVQFNVGGAFGSSASFTFSGGVVSATGFSGSGASLTGLSATELASGTVPLARIGTGSPTSSKFLKGDNSWSVLSTDDVSEGTNQYFTNARARSAISVSGDLSYDSVTGVVSYSGSSMNGAQIVSAIGYTPVNKAGDTLTGDLILAGAPQTSLSAVTKQYVDNIASGLNIHGAVIAATTSNLTATYDNGSSGVGATLSGSGSLTLGSFSSFLVGDRVLVKNQTSAVENGVYVVSTTGSNWVLTRATDFDGSNSSEVAAGSFIYVEQGDLQGTGWVQVTTGTLVVGTSDLSFSQFSGSSSLSAGTGLNLSSNTMSLATAGTAGTYGQVTTDAYGRVTSGGTAAIVNGGTGATTASGAFNALSPITSTGDLIVGSGANSASRLAIGASGKVLTSNGTTASWQSIPAAGAAQEVQFNLGGALTTSTEFTWDHNTDTLAAPYFAGSGSLLTSLNASNLATGSVPSARLGSGTANSSSFLRGDGTWSVPSFSATQVSGTSYFGTYNATTGTYVGAHTGLNQPWFIQTNMNAPTNAKISLQFIDSSGNLKFDLVNDAGSSSSSWMTVGRSGNTATNVAINATTMSLNSSVTATSLSGNGAGLTALNASNLASGTVPVARIGSSGTASSSTFLRGDNTWAIPTATVTSMTGTSAVAFTSGTNGVYVGTQSGVPLIGFAHASAPSGRKMQDFILNSSGELLFRLMNDSNGPATSWMQMSRSGNTATNVTFNATAMTLNAAVTGTSFAGSGSGLTALNASNLASGTVNTARMGSGTANSTTYLRGDGTWSVPTASAAAAGATTQVQYNNSGAMGASSSFTFNSGTGVVSATGFSGSGAELTALAAANLTGTVATARLGSGTADSTTYLRGDGTWATIPAGGVSVSTNNTWTAAQRGSVSALTYGATVTPNFDASNNFSLSLTGNATVANPTGTITPGQSGIIAISQDATGSRTVAWDTNFKAAGGVKPTLSTAPNAVDLISYYVVSPTMIFISGNLAIA